MAAKKTVVQALEINPGLIGALFTDQTDTHLRVFCYYLSGATSEFTVPLDENLDSLNHLFARLDMLGKCTSVILEKAVQGRVYVEREGALFSYTLLNTPGTAPLPITPDLCDLPWRRVWSSSEAEILELRDTRHNARRFAVRNPVNDLEAGSIYRSSHAFLHPMVLPHKSLGLRVAPVVALTVLVLLGGAGAAVWWNQRPAATPAPVRARALPPAPAAPSWQAQMLHDRRITGPFTAAELERMAAAGQLPAPALFRCEGATDWVPYHQLTNAAARP
jgi:hypothetical protein